MKEKRSWRIGLAWIALLWMLLPTSVALASSQLQAPQKFSGVKRSTTITLSWQKLSGASSYEVFQYNSKTKSWVYLASTYKTELNIRNLLPSTQYSYRMRAVDQNRKKGAFTGSINLTTDAKMSAPTRVQQKRTDANNVTITWNAVQGADKYWIFRLDENNNAIWIGSSKTQSFVHKVKANYDYCVCAATNYGDEGLLGWPKEVDLDQQPKIKTTVRPS